jgi:hypothetical protein
MWIGLLGAVFGLTFGILGGAIGIVAGVFGAMIGIVLLPFRILFGSEHCDHWPNFGINSYLLFAVIIFVFLLIHRGKKS